MEEKMRALLEKYPLEVVRLYRGRGMWICETDQGLKLIRPYKGSPQRLLWEVEIKDQLRQSGCTYIDQLICNRDGEYMTKDMDEEPYVVTDWFSGRECNTRDAKDVLKAVVYMANMHQKMGKLVLREGVESRNSSGSLLQEMSRRLREFRTIRNYISHKKQKNDFDRKFLTVCDQYLEDGKRASQILHDMDYEALYEKVRRNNILCHGDFHQHNLIVMKDGMALVHFDRMQTQLQFYDLYVFMRKILEKNHWNIGLGIEMLNAYQSVYPMDYRQMRCFYSLMLFPEKFWKITNRYYNTRKSWMSAQNMAKLDKWIREENNRRRFLKALDEYCETIE